MCGYLPTPAPGLSTGGRRHRRGRDGRDARRPDPGERGLHRADQPQPGAAPRGGHRQLQYLHVQQIDALGQRTTTDRAGDANLIYDTVGNLTAEFLATALAAALGYPLVSFLRLLLGHLGIEIAYGGDKAAILVPLLFGLPLGALVGMVLVEKVVCKTTGWNVLGLLLGLMFSAIAYIVGLGMMDLFGGEAILSVPFLVALARLLGYRIGLRICG